MSTSLLDGLRCATNPTPFYASRPGTVPCRSLDLDSPIGALANVLPGFSLAKTGRSPLNERREETARARRSD
jgi:hypothetical protein